MVRLAGAISILVGGALAPLVLVIAAARILTRPEIVTFRDAHPLLAADSCPKAAIIAALANFLCRAPPALEVAIERELKLIAIGVAANDCLRGRHDEAGIDATAMLVTVLLRPLPVATAGLDGIVVIRATLVTRSAVGVTTGHASVVDVTGCGRRAAITHPR
jgi:hypothetical protein